MAAMSCRIPLDVFPSHPVPERDRRIAHRPLMGAPPGLALIDAEIRKRSIRA
jgi:hypothetical protein